jgi:taurine dioxygenase
LPSIEVQPLADLSFGARIQGVNWAKLQDGGVRQHVAALFDEYGVLIFEDVEPSDEMQAEVSKLFGPLKDHPIQSVGRVDHNRFPGVIVIKPDPGRTPIVEVDGQLRVNWQPWHFDHFYNNELNRGGVLRSVITPPEGGQTAFADGIQLYRALSPALRAAIEGQHIVYSYDRLLFANQRFGLPNSFREVRPPDAEGARSVMETAQRLSRAVHPAVWTRSSGEKVLHVSGYGAVGIEGRENDEGNALLEAVCQEIRSKALAYIHEWHPTDMVAWDNWRMLHEGLGVDPRHDRCVHRTTIQGDYGLGYWENKTGPAHAPPTGY